MLCFCFLSRNLVLGTNYYILYIYYLYYSIMTDWYYPKAYQIASHCVQSKKHIKLESYLDRLMKER